MAWYDRVSVKVPQAMGERHRTDRHNTWSRAATGAGSHVATNTFCVFHLRARLFVFFAALPAGLAIKSSPSLDSSSSFLWPANTMWRNLLYSGFHTPKAVTYHEPTVMWWFMIGHSLGRMETCFGPSTPRCWDPISKHISNPDVAPFRQKRGALLKFVIDWRSCS